MEFFELTHPDYETDQAHSRHNPVQLKVDYYVPGIICEVCGNEWGSSDRVRVQLPQTQSVLDLLDGHSFPSTEWFRTIDHLSKALGVPKEMLRPGAQIGPPRGTLRHLRFGSFIHPFPGQMWVVSEVVDVLKANHASGVDFFPVEISLGNKLKKISAAVPKLWELVITGHAWRLGHDLARITDCHHCGRRIFPEPKWLTVDESRWDGSDFLNLDLNPNMVFVTKRVADLFEKHQFTKYRVNLS